VTESALVDVVIVNWNSGLHLSRCVESLAHAVQDLLPPARVIIVDNGSTDQSLQNIKHSTVPTAVIRNHYNTGFAAGCNQGAMAGDAEYVLFLNPDVRVARDSLRIPLNFMQQAENGHCGVCGIQLIDDHGSISLSCARFPTWQQLVAKSIALDRLLPARFPGHYLSESAHRRTGEVDQVSGAFFLVRRRLFEELGGFDERFFVYFEELDFSLRAHDVGSSSMFLASARAVHHGNASSERILATRLCYWWQSRIQYCWKHFDHKSATAVLLVTLLVEPISRLAWACIQCSAREAGATASATVKLWTGLPNLVGSVVMGHGDRRDRPAVRNGPR
jgi:GT2 family glycosyltransferase